jgi:DNA-binding NarL/FixJ family response regulator
MVDALTESISCDRAKRTRLSLSIPESVMAQLNSDEASILSLLIQGRTTKEIGSELDLSVRTIHYRKTSMFKKLGVRDRSEAVEMVRTIRRGNTVFDDSIAIFPRAS